MSKPAFADINDLLAELGYTCRTVPDSHILYELADPGMRIVLRVYTRPDEPFDSAELAYIRSTLDTWGILSREEFDERLRERSLAG